MAEFSIHNVKLEKTSVPKGDVPPQTEEKDYSTFGLEIIKDNDENDLGAIKLPDEKKLKELADKIKNGDIKTGTLKPIDSNNLKLADGRTLKDVLDELLKNDNQIKLPMDPKKLQEIMDKLEKNATFTSKELQEIINKLNEKPITLKDKEIDVPKILPYDPSAQKNKGLSIKPLPYDPNAPENKNISIKPLPYFPDAPENKNISPKPMPYPYVPNDGVLLGDDKAKNILNKFIKNNE